MGAGRGAGGGLRKVRVPGRAEVQGAPRRGVSRRGRARAGEGGRERGTLGRQPRCKVFKKFLRPRSPVSDLNSQSPADVTSGSKS